MSEPQPSRQQHTDAQYLEDARALEAAVQLARSFLGTDRPSPAWAEATAHDLARVVHKFRDLRAETDAWRRQWEAVRQALTAAGVPCFYAPDSTASEYTTEEPAWPHAGFRPLANCVKDLAARAAALAAAVERLIGATNTTIAYRKSDIADPAALDDIVKQVEQQALTRRAVATFSTPRQTTAAYAPGDPIEVEVAKGVWRPGVVVLASAARPGWPFDRVLCWWDSGAAYGSTGMVLVGSTRRPPVV